MSTSKIAEFLDEISLADVPEPVNLWPGVKELVLRAQKERTGNDQKTRGRRTSSPGWVYPAAGLAFIVVAAVAIAGPGRVLAQVQQWLGYAPGIGAVPLDGARGMAEPVSAGANGLRVTVDEFLALSDRTALRFHYSSLAGEPILYVRASVNWPGGTGLRMQKEMTEPLCGAEWSRCKPEDREGHRVSMEFEPLPVEASDVVIHLYYQFGRPGEVQSDEIRLPLRLQPVADRLVKNSYRPAGARDEHHGLLIWVENVFAGSDRTVLDLKMRSAEGKKSVQVGAVTLKDERGHVYSPVWGENSLDENPVRVETAPSSDGKGGDTIWPLRLTFEPLQPGVKQLALMVEWAPVSVDFQQELWIPITPDAAIGEEFPLDVWLEGSPVPLHLTGARIAVAPAPAMPMDKNGLQPGDKAVELQLESPVVRGDWTLDSILISPNYYEKGGWRRDEKTGIELPIIGWDPALLPKEGMLLRFSGVGAKLKGPWVLRWDAPEP